MNLAPWNQIIKWKISFFISLVNHKVSGLMKGEIINGVLDEVLNFPAKYSPPVQKGLILLRPFQVYVLLIVHSE